MKDASEITKKNYRPDIDGLRAISVLSVVIYHAFPNFLTGGFIGVDVFFVISGYLISNIIFYNLHNNKFSFINFYARRIKRIFPAVITVLVFSYLIGWLLLLPLSYEQLGKHIAGGAGFLSNIVSLYETGYFDGSANLKPLLHLWSLGIEEQFYILWPLLIWLIWKNKYVILPIILIITAASFYFNINGVKLNHTVTFYSPHTRFWEILCGCLLAWAYFIKKENLYKYLNIKKTISIPSKNESLIKNITAITGILLLLYGLFTINEGFSFPGFWAVIPVLSSVLLIYAGPDTWVNSKILSNKLAVWFGLISFPLYLWHWPLLTFSRIMESGTPSYNTRILIVIISILLAWATYKLLEQPIRFGKQSKISTAQLTISMIIIGCIGLATYKYDGLSFRFPKIVQNIMDFRFDYRTAYRSGTCFLDPEQDHTSFEGCDSTAIEGKNSILLWGDSHAAHLYPGYKATYGKSHNIIQRTASGCPPILDYTVKSRPHCNKINDKIIKYLNNKPPDKVVLAAIWTDYDLEKLNMTIRKIKESGVKNINIIGPVPQWNEGLPKQLYMYFSENIPHTVPSRMNFGLNNNFFKTDLILKEKVLPLKITYISAKEILCNDAGCITRTGESHDELTAWDYGHLTIKGSEYLVSKFHKHEQILK